MNERLAVSSLKDQKTQVDLYGSGLLECSTKEVAEILLKRVMDLYGPPHHGVCIVRVKEINVYRIYFTLKEE